MFTGAQLRMARAFLRWSVADLSARAGVGASTIQRIEQEDGPPVVAGGNLMAIHQALTEAGITFLPSDGSGMGVRGRWDEPKPELANSWRASG